MILHCGSDASSVAIARSAAKVLPLEVGTRMMQFCLDIHLGSEKSWDCHGRRDVMGGDERKYACWRNAGMW